MRRVKSAHKFDICSTGPEGCISSPWVLTALITLSNDKVMLYLIQDLGPKMLTVFISCPLKLLLQRKPALL